MRHTYRDEFLFRDFLVAIVVYCLEKICELCVSRTLVAEFDHELAELGSFNRTGTVAVCSAYKHSKHIRA
jgi:hypothetical protein